MGIKLDFKWVKQVSLDEFKKKKKKKISFKCAELIVAIYDDFESYQIYLVQLRSEFQNFAKALCEK